jgi:hypothetical protein
MCTARYNTATTAAFASHVQWVASTPSLLFSSKFLGEAVDFTSLPFHITGFLFTTTTIKGPLGVKKSSVITIGCGAFGQKAKVTRGNAGKGRALPCPFVGGVAPHRGLPLLN